MWLPYIYQARKPNYFLNIRNETQQTSDIFSDYNFNTSDVRALCAKIHHVPLQLHTSNYVCHYWHCAKTTAVHSIQCAQMVVFEATPEGVETKRSLTLCTRWFLSILSSGLACLYRQRSALLANAQYIHNNRQCYDTHNTGNIIHSF